MENGANVVMEEAAVATGELDFCQSQDVEAHPESSCG